MEAWRKIRLGDACKTNMDSYTTKEKWNFVNYLDTGNITDNKINSIQYIDVKSEKLPSRARRKVKKDSIIYSTVRPNQRHFGIVKSRPENFLVSTGFAVIDTDPHVLDADFLYYLLTQATFVEALHAIAEQSTSAYPSIKPSDIENLEIEIPDLATQKKIADILGSLDRKVIQNTEVNKNLEQQAQAIFKSWFVDFEPFNGNIPPDWKEYKLSEFLPVITGKKNANVSSINGLYPFFSCSQDLSWTDDYSFEGSAILVAGNGDFNTKFYNGKFEAYQRTYVLIPYNEKYTAWLYYAIKQNLKKITLAARGSVIKFITKGNLENFSFYAPRDLDNFYIIDNFDATNNIIASNREENIRLSMLRDTLLPKLMSGELDVSNLDL